MTKMIDLVVLITHKELSEAAQQILRESGARTVYLVPPITEDMLIETITRESVNGVLMRVSPPFTRRVLEATPTLRIIVKHGAGIDSVDLDAATERRIAVLSAGGANADPVAEYAIAAMLSLMRDVPRLDRRLRAGNWEKGTYLGREFRGCFVGIVGHGQIGRRVARMASALGAHVIAYSSSRRPAVQDLEWDDDLDRVLRRVDVLSLHCPLTDKTRGMIGQRELGLMKEGAILINTSRGPVVDEAALIAALQSGRLRGAALDVFTQEPTPADNPLFRLDNVIVTPHTSAMTHEAMIRMGTSAATQIVEFLQRGTLDKDNLANPAVAARLS
jgi:D-3-phosphoglycerate dehydrogenase